MGFRFRPMGLLVAEKILGGTIDGEEIVLAGAEGLLRSDNYDPGVAGWAIDGDGDAELNSVTVRGTVDASTVQGSTITGSTISGSTIEGSTVIVGSVIRGVNEVDNSAGGTNDIRSVGFSAGSAGWRIQANGNAEFNSVVVRGDLDTSRIVGEIDLDSSQTTWIGTDNFGSSSGWRIWGNGVADFNGAVRLGSTLDVDGRVDAFGFVNLANDVSVGGDVAISGDLQLGTSGASIGVGGQAPPSFGIRTYDQGGRFGGMTLVEHGDLFLANKEIRFQDLNPPNLDRLAFGDGDNTFHFTADDGDCNSRTAAGEYAVASSSQFGKTNIEEHNHGLDVLRKLRPVEFDIEPNTEDRPAWHRLGFIAEEIETAQPDVAAYDADGQVWGWNLPGMISVLARAAQQLDDRVTALEAA